MQAVRFDNRTAENDDPVVVTVWCLGRIAERRTTAALGLGGSRAIRDAAANPCASKWIAGTRPEWQDSETLHHSGAVRRSEALRAHRCGRTSSRVHNNKELYHDIEHDDENANADRPVNNAHCCLTTQCLTTQCLTTAGPDDSGRAHGFSECAPVHTSNASEHHAQYSCPPAPNVFPLTFAPRDRRAVPSLSVR